MALGCVEADLSGGEPLSKERNLCRSPTCQQSKRVGASMQRGRDTLCQDITRLKVERGTAKDAQPV